jgi:aminomethyltransferase
MLQRTPLFSAHQRLGARLVEFGGWEMPVQYTSIVEEHLAVRHAAGLFDISHMGQFAVKGPGAAAFLNHALTNDIRRLTVGQGQYTLLCHPDGGVVDDLYAYCTREHEFLLIVNASRIGADWDWLQTLVDHAPTHDGFQLRNVSSTHAAVAVQGPQVATFLGDVIPGGSIGGVLASRVTDLAKNQIGGFAFRGTSLLVARTGYTGEDGFEIFAEAAHIAELWDALLTGGAPHGLRPAGLGARDTLRTEMGYPLYGHELTADTTPLEAGLGVFVAFDKGDFVGRASLEAQKAAGLRRRCVAFRMTGKSAPPRPGYPIWLPVPDALVVGTVASGTQSPSLGTGIGMGYVPTTYARPGQPVEIEIRGQRAPALVVRKPIYQRPTPATAEHS